MGFFENKAQEVLNEGEIQNEILEMKLESKIDNQLVIIYLYTLIHFSNNIK